jgi:hypothetical protein
MARDLRCDADFLDQYTHPGVFACYARGMNLTHPFLLKTEFGRITHQPQMDDTAHKTLLRKLKSDLAAPKTHEPPIEDGSRGNTKVPAEADTPSIPQPQSKPAATPVPPQHASEPEDHTKPATDW